MANQNLGILTIAQVKPLYPRHRRAGWMFCAKMVRFICPPVREFKDAIFHFLTGSLRIL